MITTTILTIDQGTSSSRAMLFSRDGQLLASAQQEIHCSFPAPGLVEQDPQQIWLSVLTVCRQVLATAQQHGWQVQGVTITNQRETTLLWRRDNGEAVAPAIVWQDRRTQDTCQALQAAGYQDMIQARTGLCLDPYFSATKLQAMLQDPALRQAADAGELAFGTVDSFLLWRLTAGPSAIAGQFAGDCARHATDTTNASRTLLFNIKTLSWDEQLLQLFQIPATLLAQVQQTADDFGLVHPGWLTDVWPAEQALPIVAMCGDQQAAAIGQGCVRAGGLKSTYGTGCFALLNTGQACLLSRHRLLTTIAATVQGQTQYALEGAIFVAGAAIKWLRDQLGLIGSATETEQLAQSVSDNGGVYLVPAFTGLGAPHWRPDVTAQFSGLTLGSSKAHLVRATLEAVVYQTADLLAAMRADGAVFSSLQVDGGMVDNSWFCQQLADLLDLPVMRPLQTETTAFGGALLGGIQLGWYQSLDDLPALVRAQSWFYPQLDTAARAQQLLGWQRAVQALLAAGTANQPDAVGHARTDRPVNAAGLHGAS